MVRGRGTLVAMEMGMSDVANRNGTKGRRGLFIAGLSLFLLFGVALLKGRADSGGELD